MSEHHPHFGLTKHGLPVHLHVLDYHAADTWYQKRTQKLAQFITKHIGTMNCFFAFNILALLSLPATLKLADVHVNALYTAIPAFFLTFGWIYLITWICQNYIQLVLLPALMVGQNLQNEAADARAAKTFEDVEAVRTDLITALDRLDVHTEGGLKAVLDAVNALAATPAPGPVVHVQPRPGTPA
jgi:hypothetical protein